jgi:hypothetical protein
VSVSLANATLAGSGDSYTLGNLIGPTGKSGSYELMLRASGTGIADAAGNPFIVPTSVAWAESVYSPFATFSAITFLFA